MTPISVALSPIGDQYEGHVSKVQGVKTNFFVASPFQINIISVFVAVDVNGASGLLLKLV